MPNVKYALQHNIGLGGAAVVGIYKLGFPTNASVSSSTLSSSSSDLKSTTSQLKSGKFFDDIESRLKQDSTLVSKINAIIDFNIGVADNKAISFIVDVKNAPGSVKVNTEGSKSNIFSDDIYPIVINL